MVITESRCNFGYNFIYMRTNRKKTRIETIIALRYHGVSVHSDLLRLLIRTWEKLRVLDESMLNERVRRNINNYTYMLPYSLECIVPKFLTKFGEIRCTLLIKITAIRRKRMKKRFRLYRYLLIKKEEENEQLERRDWKERPLSSNKRIRCGSRSIEEEPTIIYIFIYKSAFLMLHTRCRSLPSLSPAPNEN